ncbi:ATP-dependent DNA ligase [archaeon]|nr:ATP-dependent DNA ligase [archaeon]
MDFSEAAKVFSAVEEKSGRLEMTGLLAGLFRKSDAEEIKPLVYLCLGSLGPEFDRSNAGMAEKMVINALVNATGFEKQAIEKDFKKKGDLGLVAEELVEKKTQKSLVSRNLSVKNVFDSFIKISMASGAGSQDLKAKLLAELFNSAKGIEARYICRIPLEALRLGIGDASVIDALALNLLEEAGKDKKLMQEIEAGLKEKKEEKRLEETGKRLRMKLHELIEAKYNIHPDLGLIAEKLWVKGLNGLKEIDLEPGIPIRPTLAERLPNAEEIIKKLGKCFVEPKFDGFRLAVHKKKDKVIIYSRRQEEMTSMFPELVEAARKQLNAETAILEGEAIAFNEETNEFYPFQVTIQRKRKHGIEEKAGEFPLKLFAFDIVFLDGKNLMQLPFIERRKILEKTIKDGEVIKVTQGITTDSAVELEDFFNQNIANGLEGIIAKDLNEKYIAGARKFAWIKLKRSYAGKLEDTIDVVIIGYLKGRGKRAEFGLGALLTAVYDNKNNEFKSIAKIGTGFSEEQLKQLYSMLSKIKSKEKPKNVDSVLEPDEWVEPKYVIEVLADEITRSPIHTAAGGLALRFPRLIKFREDKRPVKSQKHIKKE